MRPDTLLSMMAIALDMASRATCFAADRNGSGTVTVDEMIAAINNARGGCSVFLPALQPWQEVPRFVGVPQPAHAVGTAAEAERLAASWFALQGTAVDGGDRWIVAAGDRQLTLTKVGDLLRYREPAAAATDPPVSADMALLAAQLFLTTEGWGGPEVVWQAPVALTGLDGGIRAWRVAFEVMIVAGDRDGEQFPAHVPAMTSAIDVGAAGRFVGADVRWFGVMPAGLDSFALTVAPPVADAARALHVDPATLGVHFMYQTTGSGADAPLVPWFVMGPRDVPLELLLNEENPFAAQLAPATTVAPIALFDAGVFMSPQDASKPVTLSAFVKLGTPPYDIEWRSDRRGVLGRGNPITVSFPPGEHLIELLVNDARGRAAPPVVDMLVVAGDGTLTEAGAAEAPGVAEVTAPLNLAADAVSTWTWRAEPTDSDGIAFRDIKLVRNFENGKTDEWPNQASVVARQVTVPSFRYTMTIEGPGLDRPVYLDSGKCDLVRGGTLACGRQTTMRLADGPTQDGQRVQATYVAENLPGTLRLTVNYQFGIGAFCTPGLNAQARAVMGLALPNALSGTIAGQCAAFRPELMWSYAPPKDCMNGPAIAAACDGIAGAWRCSGAVSSMLMNADDNVAARVTDFTLTLYTRILTFGEGASSFAVFVQDGQSLTPPSIPKTLGPKHCEDRLGAILSLFPDFIASKLEAFGDAFCAMEPMPTENAGQFAVDNAPSGQPAGTEYWDNVHLKVRDGPFADPATGRPFQSRFIYFPQGNDPLDERDANPTIHIHERWPESRARGTNFSLGQNVRFLVVAERPGEDDPDDPETLVNGEPAREAGGIVVWHISSANSRRCDPVGSPQTPGLVDNTHRPCHVFSSPLFMSGPYDELPPGTPTEWGGYRVTPLSGPLPAPQPMCKVMPHGPCNDASCYASCVAIPGIYTGSCLVDGTCDCQCGGSYESFALCQGICGNKNAVCADPDYCCWDPDKVTTYGCQCDCPPCGS